MLAKVRAPAPEIDDASLAATAVMANSPQNKKVDIPRKSLSSPRSVRFVGTLLIIPGQAPLPSWADELDGSRKVVLVTHGTFSNHDFNQFVAPTLEALAGEPDVLVVVTNGGYGSVSQALSFGNPIVSAGLTENKADVNARVSWSGVGIDLATNAPTSRALQDAIRSVLHRPQYRAGAQAVAQEFADTDTQSELFAAFEALARTNTRLAEGA